MNKYSISALLNELNQKEIGDINLKDLIGPGRYAEQIVDEAKLTRVQLRKIFAEFKNVFNKFENREKPEKIQINLYKLYPLLKYQQNRKLIKNKDFIRLLFKILDQLDESLKKPENEKTKKNFEYAQEFIQALVAYIRND